jgi:hypothetical protein
MAGNANSGRGDGPQHREALLSLLEVHTEGATAPELASYANRNLPAARVQLLRLLEQGKVYQDKDHLWHLTTQEADHRSLLLTPALPKLPAPVRTRSKGR